jgi:hypothetical protein
MKHTQDKNAFAYVIYEKRLQGTVESGAKQEWIRSTMFYADDPKYSDRDACWEFNIAWRDPKNIRVVPLYDEAGNDARRDDNLELINAHYQAEVHLVNRTVSLDSAVTTALETELPVERFEGLLKTLQAFDSQLMDQLQVPPHTVQRAEYLPSVEQMEYLTAIIKD